MLFDSDVIRLFFLGDDAHVGTEVVLLQKKLQLGAGLLVVAGKEVVPERQLGAGRVVPHIVAQRLDI